MLEKLSISIVRKMVTGGVVPSGDEKLYAYGIQQSLVLLINTFSVVILGILTGMLPEAILFYLAYAGLRTYAGGYHAEGPIRCYIYSMALIAAVLFLINAVTLTAPVLICVALASSFLIVRLAPVESKNKPLSDPERAHHKSIVRNIVAIELITAAFLAALGFAVFAACIVLAFISVLLLMLKERYSFDHNNNHRIH